MNFYRPGKLKVAVVAVAIRPEPSVSTTDHGRGGCGGFSSFLYLSRIEGSDLLPSFPPSFSGV